MSKALEERFVRDLAFILSILTHVIVIFCLLYVLANLRAVMNWVGLTKGDPNSRSPSSWLEWLGLRTRKNKEDGKEADEEEDMEAKGMIQGMIANNKIDLLYDALGKVVVPPKQTKKKKAAATPRSRSAIANDETKTVHNIFDEYLGENFLNKLRLNYNEIYEIFRERAIPLIEELEEDKPIIVEIIDTMVKRMVLSLLIQDKVAFKVRTDMVDRIEALYDHCNGVPILDVKNDFVHYDDVNAMINRRCKEALDQNTDEIYARFSEPKKRGRHPKLRPEEVINEVESIAGEYIAKRLSLTQTANALAATPSSSTATTTTTTTTSTTANGAAGGIDYYPIFSQTLAVYDKCIPKLNNHGFYIERLIQMIRHLDSSVWPLHGLMSMLNNLNYCVHADTVKMSFDRSKRRFYCCYSGLEIHDGETVTCLRVVENDAVRLKEWRENPMLISKPFEAPEFTRSVGAFYMKKELCCASTLVFTPFSERYKAFFPEYFNPAPVKPVALVKKPKQKRVHKPKRKAEEIEEVKEVVKKPKVSVEEDDCLFESLSTYATNNKSSVETSLRQYMTCLCHQKGASSSIWHMERSLSEVQDIVWPALERMPKKLFASEMHKIIADAHVVEEGEVEACYMAILDFTEALIVPEKSISAYASTQKVDTIRALLYATRKHSKERAENPFLRLKRTDEIASSYWLKKCPLLFIVIFEYLAYYEEPIEYLKSSPLARLDHETLFYDLDLLSTELQ